MPTIGREGGYRFFFYSNEGNPREPRHVHVRHGPREAKFWLRPEVVLAYNDGFNARQLNELQDLVELHRERFEGAWDDYFA